MRAMSEFRKQEICLVGRDQSLLAAARARRSFRGYLISPLAEVL